MFSEKSSPAKSQDTGKKPATLSSPASEIPREEVVTPTQIKRISDASSLAPSSASYRQNRHSYPRQPRPLNTGHSRQSQLISRLPPSHPAAHIDARRLGYEDANPHRPRCPQFAAFTILALTPRHLQFPLIAWTQYQHRLPESLKSPHSSIKVLPTTPGASARFPSNIRLVRGPSGAPKEFGEYLVPGPSTFNEAAPTPILYSPSSSLVFARRKRSAFKGPMINTSNLMASGGMVHSPIPGQPEEAASQSQLVGLLHARAK